MKKPEISDEEIRAYMDFDRVLIQHQTLKDVARNHFLKKFILGSSVIVVGLIAGLWFFKNSNTNVVETKPQAEKNIPANSIDSTNQSIPKVVDEKSENVPATPKPEHTTKKSKAITQSQIAEGDAEKKSVQSTEKLSETPTAPQPVYAQAEPVDGYPKLYQYFSTDLKYPETMMKDSIQGVVMVMFTINVKGEPEKITIDQSLGKAFDEEAIRLITKMPPWKPATYNNKPVPSRISLPITFQIQKLKLEQ